MGDALYTAQKCNDKATLGLIAYFYQHSILAEPGDGKIRFFDNEDAHDPDWIGIVPVLDEDTLYIDGWAEFVRDNGPLVVIPDSKSLFVCGRLDLSQFWRGFEFLHSSLALYLLIKKLDVKKNRDGEELVIQYVVHNKDCALLDSLGGQSYRECLQECVQYMEAYAKMNGDTIGEFFPSAKFIGPANDMLGPYLSANDSLYRRGVVAYHGLCLLLEDHFGEKKAKRMTLQFLFDVNNFAVNSH